MCAGRGWLRGAFLKCLLNSALGYADDVAVAAVAVAAVAAAAVTTAVAAAVVPAVTDVVVVVRGVVVSYVFAASLSS